MNKRAAYLLLLLLIVGCFSLATYLQPWAMRWSQRGQDSVLKVALGDGRRIFANHFFTKADVYFHSGYYPSVFDRQNKPKENHLAAQRGHDESEEDEKAADFLGKPRDWVEAFGRHFMITSHTHLEHGKEREILPWLKLSAELDPQLLDTYTVGAYYLANQLGKVKEAKEFLREGLRANPESYELLFSLGEICYRNEHDSTSARNLWELALRRWREREAQGKNPDNLSLDSITVNLAHLEEEAGNLDRAIGYLQQARQVSPFPQKVEKQINDLKGKLPPKHS